MCTPKVCESVNILPINTSEEREEKKRVSQPIKNSRTKALNAQRIFNVLCRFGFNIQNINSTKVEKSIPRMVHIYKYPPYRL